MINYDQRRIRTGKTKKDRESGATARNIMNKRLRADWYDDNKSTAGSFPRQTCNGKKNRYLK